jgi:hypothetical protein
MSESTKKNWAKVVGIVVQAVISALTALGVLGCTTIN